MRDEPGGIADHTLQKVSARKPLTGLLKLLDSVLLVLSIGALGFLAYVGVRPGGIIAVRYEKWKSERRIAATLGRTWERLAASSSRVDSARGKAVLVEFSDYQCPYCKQQYFVFQRLLEETPALRIAYRHVPNSRHPASRGAALAAICAERMGRFREMHRLLFETIQWQVDTNWIALGKQAGIADTVAFESCLGDSTTLTRLNEDVQLAESLEIAGTPGLVSHRRVVQGVKLPATVTSLANGE